MEILSLFFYLSAFKRQIVELIWIKTTPLNELFSVIKCISTLLVDFFKDFKHVNETGDF